MGNETTTATAHKPVKQSELDKFRLFYEFVTDDSTPASTKNSKRRTIRLTDTPK